MGYRTDREFSTVIGMKINFLKVFNFTSTEGNTNGRCSEMLSCPVSMAVLRNQKTVTAEGVGQEERLIVGGKPVQPI